MAQREGSIYLYLFIAASVLFLAMTVFFFVVNAERDNLERQLAQARSDNDVFEGRQERLAGRNRELRALIGGATAADAEDWSDDQYTRQLEDQVAFAIGEVVGSPRAYTYLTEPFPDLQRIFKKLVDERDGAMQERERLISENMQAQATAEKTLADVNQNHNQTLEDLQTCQDELEDTRNKSNEEKEQLLQQISSQEEESSDEIIKLRRRINALNNEKASLALRLEDCQRETLQEKTIDDIQADGEIVNLLSSSGKAWVNLGRQSNLYNGVVFRVYQEGKSGKKYIKGSVEVQKVGEETSEVRIAEELDSLNPIVIGDKISSPFYDPRARPVFVFAGNELETKEVTRDYLESRIRGYGGEIRDQVDINTDFLVAIKNYENSAQYKAARELGVTIIRERVLLEFIGR